MMYIYQNKMIRGPWVDANGTQYPSGWVEGATPEQLAVIGVQVVPDIPVPEHNTETHRAEHQDDGSWVLVALPPPPIPSVVSPAQIRIALNEMGLRDQVEAAVSAGPQDLKDWWEYSTEIQRNHPLVIQMAEGLGVSSEQVDALFILANQK